MIEFGAMMESGSLPPLLWTALALGFLHTILGPDHYIPFVMMAKAQNWTRSKTALISFLCGLGHVVSSVIIGVILATAGMAFSEWEGSGWSAWHESRGSLAAWLLMGAGAAFFVWGVIRALRGHTHTHVHVHDDGTNHHHEHNHTERHMHIHNDKKNKVKRVTPWVLFIIFIFGPCESLIPLMLAAWAITGLGGTVLVAGVFSAITILTIMVAVGLLLMGVSRIPLGRMDRWSTAVAGLSLVLCGAAIQWLGL